MVTTKAGATAKAQSMIQMPVVRYGCIHSLHKAQWFSGCDNVYVNPVKSRSDGCCACFSYSSQYVAGSVGSQLLHLYNKIHLHHLHGKEQALIA